MYELCTLDGVPDIPFYVIILVTSNKVFYTEDKDIWEREIRKRKDYILYFPISQQSQLTELKHFYD